MVFGEKHGFDLRANPGLASAFTKWLHNQGTMNAMITCDAGDIIDSRLSEHDTELKLEKITNK